MKVGGATLSLKFIAEKAVGRAFRALTEHVGDQFVFVSMIDMIAIANGPILCTHLTPRIRFVVNEWEGVMASLARRI
jgi:hypothetical protein